MGNCVLCKSNAVISRQDSASRTIYNCNNCGVFVVSDLVEKNVEKHVQEISAFLTMRRLLKKSDTVLISFEKANLDKDYLQLTVDQIINLYPKDFTEQMDMALKNLELMSDFAGDEVKIDDLKLAPVFYVKKSSFEALSYVIKAMNKAELIDVNYYSSSFFPCGIIISPKGWDRLANLQKNHMENDNLFACVSRAEKQIREQFLKAARKASLECELHITDNFFTDTEAKIGNELIAAVKSSKAVVCDLTEFSGEAYYTAALARALNKVCILTCNKSAEKKLQINTNELHVIFWDKPDQLYLELANGLKANL